MSLIFDYLFYTSNALDGSCLILVADIVLIFLLADIISAMPPLGTFLPTFVHELVDFDDAQLGIELLTCRP